MSRVSLKQKVAALTVTCPHWARIGHSFPFGFRVEAAPARASGISTRSYTLLVMIDPVSGNINVEEAPGHRLLPEACPERHINDNGTFCIGLRAGELIRDQSSAGEWWRKLSVFLTSQETAHETGEWPPMLQISHGDAAEIQLKAEALASRIGRLEDYRNAIAFGIGPIARYANEVSAVTGRLRNGSAECVCGRTTRQGRPKKRRQCAKDNDPCLPVIEAKRRRAEQAFWKEREGQRCCETMRECPLARSR